MGADRVGLRTSFGVDILERFESVHDVVKLSSDTEDTAFHLDRLARAGMQVWFTRR